MNIWKVKPTSANETLPKEAIVILRKLERAFNNKQKRKYNKILKDLREQYPDKAHIIESHFIKTNHKRKPKTLSPQDKEWIESWKHIRN